MGNKDANKDDRAYLHLMQDAFGKISEFIGGMSFDDFASDRKTQSAVIMQLQVAGELAKKVPDSIRSDIALPWKQIAGLRDVVSHDYFSLDPKIVWQTAKQSAPEAEMKIKTYLHK